MGKKSKKKSHSKEKKEKKQKKDKKEKKEAIKQSQPVIDYQTGPIDKSLRGIRHIKHTKVEAIVNKYRETGELDRDLLRRYSSKKPSKVDQQDARQSSAGADIASTAAMLKYEDVLNTVEDLMKMQPNVSKMTKLERSVLKRNLRKQAEQMLLQKVEKQNTPILSEPTIVAQQSSILQDIIEKVKIIKDDDLVIQKVRDSAFESEKFLSRAQVLLTEVKKLDQVFSQAKAKIREVIDDAESYVKDVVAQLEQKMQKVVSSYDPALLTSAREIEGVIKRHTDRMEDLEVNIKSYIELVAGIVRYEPFKKKLSRVKMNRDDSERVIYRPRKINLPSETQHIDLGGFVPDKLIGQVNNFIAFSSNQNDRETTVVFKMDFADPLNPLFIPVLQQSKVFKTFFVQQDRYILDYHIYQYSEEKNKFKLIQIIEEPIYLAAAVYCYGTETLIYGLSEYLKFSIYDFDYDKNQYGWYSRPHLRKMGLNFKLAPFTQISVDKWNQEYLFASYTNHISKFTYEDLRRCSTHQRETIRQEEIFFGDSDVVDFRDIDEQYICVMTAAPRISVIDKYTKDVIYVLKAKNRQAASYRALKVTQDNCYVLPYLEPQSCILLSPSFQTFSHPILLMLMDQRFFITDVGASGAQISDLGLNIGVSKVIGECFRYDQLAEERMCDTATFPIEGSRWIIVIDSCGRVQLMRVGMEQEEVFII